MSKIYWITGSQDLYGKETLDSVDKNSKQIVTSLNKDKLIDNKIVYLGIAKNDTEIKNYIKKVNNDDECIGVMVWMHTFSPAKMWINGLKILNKPLLHFATQFANKIPWETIDMDYMNLHQSAHGDREFGFITSRMNINRQILVGHYEDVNNIKAIGDWICICDTVNKSKNLKIARFGDNMRNVAVTEGDKLEAHIQLGWQVDYYGIGDLVNLIEQVSEKDVLELIKNYETKYTFDESYQDKTFYQAQIKYQAKIEIALKKFLQAGNYHAFTSNFEDLWNMEQLPGLAVQNLLAQGYGFAGEGDWKTAGLTYLIKNLNKNQRVGFMEDYTYDLKDGDELILGAHMLEVCPTLASDKPKVVVSNLGIGGKKDPARLVFNGISGSGYCVSLVDKRSGFELIATEVEAIAAPQTPNLPVGKLVWKLKNDFKESIKNWIYEGGAHHTVVSLNNDINNLIKLAKILQIDLKIV